MILAALLLGLALQDEPPPRAVPGAPALELPRSVQDNGWPGALGQPALNLPRAKPGAWDDWNELVPPPQDTRASLVAGNQAYRERDLPRALAHYWTVLQHAPDQPAVLHQVGVIYVKLRRHADAAHCFERFLEIAPEAVRTTRAYGHALYGLGRYAEARAHYDEILEVDPDQQEARRGLALAHWRMGDGARAAEAFEEVVRARPEHAEAHAQFAQVLFDLERLEEASAQADAAIAIDPLMARAWFVRARSAYELGEDEAGDAAQARFLELDAYQQQVRALRNQLLIQPRRLDLWLALLDAHREAANPAGAREALARLSELDPDTPRFGIQAIEVLEELGDADGARQAVRFLAENHGNSKAAWRAIEAYAARIGDDRGVSRARAALERLGAGD